MIDSKKYLIILAKSKITLYLTCIIITCLYCLGIHSGTTISQNISTILYVLFLAWLTLSNTLILKKEQTPIKTILIQLFLLSITIAISAKILNSPDSFFWVSDSIKTHIPESLRYTHYFQGLGNDGQMGIHSGKSTHALTGFFFYLFGQNSFATILAQLFYKLIATFFIYLGTKELFDEYTGVVASLLYGLCPTVFFYNLVLYKESAIQAFVAAIIYFSLKCFKDKKYIFIIPLIISGWLLLRERFYIAYLMTLMIAGLFYQFQMKKNFINHLGSLVVILITLFLVIKNAPIPFEKIPETLVQYRNFHASYTDVSSKYNYEIPYALAFVKIIFTPFFAPNKIAMFKDYSCLLTWGSFTNQIIILFSLIGFYKALRTNFFHLYLWIPFILFLAFTAYITPWSGRLRDSFYPLIACYSAYALINNKYLSQFLKLENNSRDN